jgi:hypothetical protein
MKNKRWGLRAHDRERQQGARVEGESGLRVNDRKHKEREQKERVKIKSRKWKEKCRA